MCETDEGCATWTGSPDAECSTELMFYANSQVRVQEAGAVGLMVPDQSA